MSARPIEGLEFFNYSGFDRQIHELQRKLFDDYDLRRQFHVEWKERESIYLENGLGKSEAMTKAIREVRDKWLSRT